MSQRTPNHPIHAQFINRWSPRAFADEPIAEAQLLSLLEAARWAPSGYNAQPWRFIWARRGTPEWAPLFATLSAYNQGWAQRASALVLVVSQHRWTPPGKSEPKPTAPTPSTPARLGRTWPCRPALMAGPPMALAALMLGWREAIWAFPMTSRLKP
jgi:nitroreductase